MHEPATEKNHLLHKFPPRTRVHRVLCYYGIQDNTVHLTFSKFLVHHPRCKHGAVCCHNLSARSASLQTDVFAQRYTLVVVHAGNGVATETTNAAAETRPVHAIKRHITVATEPVMSADTHNGLICYCWKTELTDPSVHAYNLHTDLERGNYSAYYT